MILIWRLWAYLQDEGGDGLGELRSCLHDPEAQRNDLGRQEEVDHLLDDDMMVLFHNIYVNFDICLILAKVGGRILHLSDNGVIHAVAPYENPCNLFSRFHVLQPQSHFGLS